jgi:primosomal replication protein N
MICLFSIKNVEKYKLADGRAAQHDNTLVVEVLGRNAQRCLEEVKIGERYQVNGYVRVDDANGTERVRIRAYHVEKE